MWYYYGCKRRIAKYYPMPNKDIIIEPFCGSAQYSLFGNNWKKQVILYDKDPIITELWDYLINYATKKEILSLPNMYFGESVDDVDCNKQLKNLIGFCINSGVTAPRKTVSNYNSWNHAKIKIANDLYKIKHWKVFNDSYENIENIDATWFIDPPYQKGGEYYRCSSKFIDYNNLSDWCKSRKGQVIVCENMGANWMDFKPLTKMNGGGCTHRVTMEAIWYNNNGDSKNKWIDDIFDL